MSIISYNEILGSSKGETLVGTAAADQIMANAGNDTVSGGASNDHIVGDTENASVFQTDLLEIAQDGSLKVTFNFEEAGYKNSLGVYKVDEEGNFYDISFMWENASLENSGGDLISDESSVEIEVEAGDDIGFFLIANGYGYNNFSQFEEGGDFAFVNADGTEATIDSTKPQLVYVSEDGTQSKLSGNIYHSAGFDERAALNADGQAHTLGYMQNDSGAFQIGFEDLYNGGDEDYDDAVFTVEIDADSVEILNEHYETELAQATEGMYINTHSYMSTDAGNDRLSGNLGADFIEGNQGNDLLAGGGAGAEWSLVDGAWVYDASSVAQGADYVMDEEDDILDGGEGNDVLLGGRGDDVLDGMSGNDTLNGGQGDDVANGGSGNDILNLEDGEDKAAGGMGADTINGGSGDDVLDGGEGADNLRGGDDNDTLDGGADADTLYGGEGDDQANGGEGADMVYGNNGSDILSGGAGNDKLVGGKGEDVLEGGEGNDHLWGGNWSADGDVDTFVFTQNSGKDMIHDFEQGIDMLDFSAFDMTFDEIMENAEDRAWCVAFDLGENPDDACLIVKSVGLADLTLDTFII